MSDYPAAVADRSVVLSRSPRVERLVRIRLTVQVWVRWPLTVLIVLVAAIAAIAATVPVWLLVLSAAGLIPLAVVEARDLSRWTQLRKVERQLADLQLQLHPGHVAYACIAGVWSAPWTAVRRVAVVGRPDGIGRPAHALLVDVACWGGPLAAYGPVCQLQIPLEGTDADLAAIDALVTSASSGPPHPHHQRPRTDHAMITFLTYNLLDYDHHQSPAELQRQNLVEEVIRAGRPDVIAVQALPGPSQLRAEQTLEHLAERTRMVCRLGSDYSGPVAATPSGHDDLGIGLM